MTSQCDPIRLAGVDLGPLRHVCGFFHTADEEYRVLLPFIKEGIDEGEKTFHVVDPERREEHLRRLESAGIPVEEAQRKGQLEIVHWAEAWRQDQVEVLGWDEAYLRDGHFDQEAMLTLIEDTLRRARSEGYPRTRLVGQMEWALQGLPGVQHLVEYEVRLNQILPEYDDPVI